MRPRSLLGCLALAACGGPPAPTSPQQPTGTALAPFVHDFGVLPHGESRAHEFDVDLAALGAPFVPLRVHLDCACGHADLRLRHHDGRERFVDGSGGSQSLPGPGERLVLRVVVDTAMREAVDLPPTSSRGYVLLQAADDPTGTSRVQWPITVRFGVESPVLLRPFAALDFGRVPQSQAGEVVTTLRGDEQHADATFGPARAEHPDLTVTLEPAADHVLVRARCRPGSLGSHRAEVWVDTSLPGYRLRLVATWKVVPDLEANPLPKVSLRAALSRAQRPNEIESQFVLLTDHDLRRSPEFAVHRIVGADGRDLSPHFDVTFQPIPHQPRQQRMFVRYTGGLEASVRGSIVLTKSGGDGPFLPIELVVFPAKDP